MASFLGTMFDYGREIVQDMVTPDPDMDRGEVYARRQDRHELKKRTNSVLSNYDGVDDPNWDKPIWTDEDGNEHKGLADLEFVTGSWKLLNGDLELTYDELAYDDFFLNNAKALYKAEHGQAYTGSERDLVEETFEKFNWMEFNVALTGAQQLTDKMFYDDFDLKGLEAMQNAYSMFIETDATGRGSRAFQNQLWDFIKGTAGDPLSYPIAIRKFMKGGSNVIKLGAKKAFQKQMSDRIAGLVGASTYTGMYSGAMNTNLQNVKMDLDMKDNFSFGELGLSTTVGAALPPAIALTGLGAKVVTQKVSDVLEKVNPHLGFEIPIISKDISKLIGGIQRAIVHPYQAWYGRGMVHQGEGTIKGKKGAILGVMSDIRDSAIAQSSKQSVKEFQTALNDGVINPMNKTIQQGYESLIYKDMTMADARKIEMEIQKIINTVAKNPNFKIEGDMKKYFDLIMPHLSDDYAALEGQIINKNINAMEIYQNNLKRLERELEDIRKRDPWFQTGDGFAKQAEIAALKRQKPVEESVPLPEFLTAKGIDGNKVDDISVTFNKLRTELHNSSQDAFKGGNSNAANAYKKIREIITNAQRNQLSTKGDKMAWDALTKASEDFKTILGKTTIGKDFAAILEKMKQANYNRTKTNPEGVPDPSHELADALEKDVDILVSKMLEKIIDTKHSFPLLLQFEKAMNAIDYRTNNINKVLNRKKAPEMETEMYAHYIQKNFKKYPELENINISKFPINDYPQRIEKVISKLADERLTPIGNESYPALKEIIRSRFGENLKQDISSLDQGGLGFIGKVLDRENGFDLVKHLYPEHADDLVKIQSLKRFLEKKVLKKHSQSVIVNMTFASLAMEAGQMIGGRLVAAGSTLGVMGGLQGWRNLIGNRKFQTRMVEILNNEGRISTKTAQKLKEQFGFDDAGIRGIQDDLNNMLITMPVIKNKKDLRDTVEKRMLQ